MTLGLETNPLLGEILGAALALRRDLVADLNDEEWLLEYESRAFPRQVAVAELAKLEHANRLQTQFELQEHHAMLTYFALQVWVEEHNQRVLDSGSASQVGPFAVGWIAFAEVVEQLIVDEDFLEPPDLVNQTEMREALGYSSETWSIANGLAAHPDELKLVARHPECSWEDRVRHYIPGERYPADCSSVKNAEECGPECFWTLDLG